MEEEQPKPRRVYSELTIEELNGGPDLYSGEVKRTVGRDEIENSADVNLKYKFTQKWIFFYTKIHFS
ncbi:Uncharacterized protein APZ42_013376 [Daphnia magna]|uniref:Uncharacterized protein n=1 Tax=Daphnia magna TaxID=35525 RepID=A0A162QXJ8_9CRUS|nr:Uncharacterized protein APZ42_013376 [Daphnia magna]